MGFEKFTKTGKSYRPKVSVRSNGQIGFSQGAVKHFDMAKYKFCILFFDQENNKIGIKFSNNEQEEGVCKLQIKNDNGAVSAKSFLDYYAIKYSETEAYVAVWDEKEGMIIIDLNKKP